MSSCESTMFMEKKRHLKHVQIKFPIVPLKKYKFPTTTRVPQNGSQGTHNAQGVLNLISNRIFGQSIIVVSTVRLTQLFTILIVSVLTIRLCLHQCYLHVQEVIWTNISISAGSIPWDEGETVIQTNEGGGVRAPRAPPLEPPPSISHSV